MELSTELVTIEPGGRIDFASGIGTGHPGRVNAGTYGDPVLSDAPGETFWQLWAKATGIGHVYGMRVNVQADNVSPNTHNAGRFELDLTGEGGLPGGGAAIHAAADLGAGNAGISGLFSGLNAAMIVGLGTGALGGKFAALTMQTELKAGVTFGQEMSFAACIDSGPVKAPYWLDIQLLTTGASHAFVTGTHGGSTVGGVLRCITPFGDGYIKIYSD